MIFNLSQKELTAELRKKRVEDMSITNRRLFRKFPFDRYIGMEAEEKRLMVEGINDLLENEYQDLLDIFPEIHAGKTRRVLIDPDTSFCKELTVSLERESWEVLHPSDLI